MYAFYDFIVFFLPNPFAELDLGLELWIFAEELKVFFFLSFFALHAQPLDCLMTSEM